MRNAIIGSVIAIFISAGVGRAATFSEEVPDSLVLDKMDILECQFVAHARVIMYFVMEKVVDNGHGRQPPIQAWKVPVTEQGQPNFKKAALMAMLPQGYKIRRKPFLFVSIVGDRVFCLSRFQNSACERVSFVTFLLSEEFSVFHERYQWKGSPIIPNFIDGDLPRPNTMPIITDDMDILAITIGEKDKIVITAINEDQNIVVVESVDNGKTWARPRVLDVSQVTVSSEPAQRKADEQKK